MTYYCGIDLHSNNHYVCVIDDEDNRVLERKLDNDADLLIACLTEYKDELMAVAIESTFNWYWLSDALTESFPKIVEPTAGYLTFVLKNTRLIFTIAFCQAEFPLIRILLNRRLSWAEKLGSSQHP